MSRHRRLPLFLAAFFVAVLTLPLISSCTKEETSTDGTPTPATSESKLLVDPVQIDSGYVAGTVVGDVGQGSEGLSRHTLRGAAGR